MIEIASIMQELMNNTGMMFSSLGSHYIYCSVQTFSHHIFYCSVQAFLSDSDCL